MAENGAVKGITIAVVAIVAYFILESYMAQQTAQQANAQKGAIVGTGVGLAASLINGLFGKCNLKTPSMLTANCAAPCSACYVGATNQSPSTSVKNAPAKGASPVSSQSICCGCNSTSSPFGVGKTPAKDPNSSVYICCSNNYQTAVCVACFGACET